LPRFLLLDFLPELNLKGLEVSRFGPESSTRVSDSFTFSRPHALVEAIEHIPQMIEHHRIGPTTLHSRISLAMRLLKLPALREPTQRTDKPNSPPALTAVRSCSPASARFRPHPPEIPQVIAAGTFLTA
jgi:hypothetical protein